jgi:hypothetical protein
LADDRGATLFGGDQEREDRAAEGLLLSGIITSRDLASQLGAWGHEPGDGEHEIGGLRRIGRIDDGLGRALGRDEAGVAALPAVELSVEKGTPGGVALEARQVAIQAREKSCGAVQPRRSRRVIFAFWRHRSFQREVALES